MRQVLCLMVVLTAGARLVCNAQTRSSGPQCINLSAVERRKPFLLLSSEAVRKAIDRAFELSGSGTMNVEFGFGVTEPAEGCFETTAVTRGDAGVWRATLPAALIAIFHTHRNGSSATPSAQDILEADRLQKSIYVISSRSLWVYEPSPRRGSKGRSYVCPRIEVAR
jgi:hypothetical protein